MKLHEYEAKQIFAGHGIPVPRGSIASTPGKAGEVTRQIGGSVVVKAQVLVAGRGKAGGIRLANSYAEAEAEARDLLGSLVKNCRVEQVLVEEKASIARELYLGLTLSRGTRRFTFLASGEGGIDIETLASEEPEKIVRLEVNPLLGLRDFEARRLARGLGFRGDEALALISTVKKIYGIAQEYDCELVESNPFAFTQEGEFMALDARIIVDDNALFRHPIFREKSRVEQRLTEFEVKAAEAGFSYVELDGDIGVMGNGAGLTMASMDIVAFCGGRPANFVDLGGGVRAERVKDAMEIQLSHPRVKTIFVNIMGGITRCDEVAQGIVEAHEIFDTKKPTVVRMTGLREEEGRKILDEVDIEFHESMDEAAAKAVEAAAKV